MTAPQDLSANLYPDLAAAIAAWGAQGGRLHLDGTYQVSAPIDCRLAPGRAHRLTASAGTVVRYVGRPARHMIRIEPTGRNDLVIDCGAATFDANRIVNCPLFIQSFATPADRGTTRVTGRFRNARSNVRGTGDISGLRVVGAHRLVHVHDVDVDGVTRIAGACDPGYNGSQGVCVVGGDTHNILDILIERVSVRGMTTEDAVTSKYYVDLDGILVFQALERGARGPVIRGATLRDCPGRAIKVYAPTGGGEVRDITILRGTHGGGKAFGGHSIDIDIQHGDGIVSGVRIAYSNDAHYTPTIPIQMAVVNRRTAANPFGPATIEDVVITDSTNVVRQAVVSLHDNSGAGGGTRRAITLRDIADYGKARMLFVSGQAGAEARCDIVIADVNCHVTEAATVTSDPQPNLFVRAANLANRNTVAVPVKHNLGGGMALVTWGDWLAEGPVTGFATYYGGWRGMVGWTNGFRGAAVGGVETRPKPGTSESVGRSVLPVVTLANGATWTGPPVGAYQSIGGDYGFTFRIVGVSGVGRWVAVVGGSRLTPVSAFPTAQVEVTDRGADTRTPGKVVLWKNAATQRQMVSNHSGRPVAFQIVYNP